MLGISRWTRRGGSDRTLPRLFSPPSMEKYLNEMLIAPLLRQAQKTIIVAGSDGRYLSLIEFSQ